MSEVYTSLGSNVDREKNIPRAAFGPLRLSPVYQSAAVGFDGEDFLNLVVGFDTDRTVGEVVAELHRIEDELGRDRNQSRYSPRPIDIDILIYGGLIMDESGIRVPREEILESAYVLKPLRDLIPGHRHPLEGRSYQDLWKEMSPNAPRLDVVELMLD